MGLELRRVHDYEKGPGNTVVMKRINPAIRIRWSAADPPVFIQSGEFYSEGGQRVSREDLPEGFWKEAGRLSEQARRECGLVLPGDVATAEARPKKAVRFGRTPVPKEAEAPAQPGDEVATLQADMKQLAGTVDKLVGAVNTLLEGQAKAPKKGKRRAAA